MAATAKIEACAGCHGGAGQAHQDVYDQYTDPTNFTVTIDSVATANNADGVLVSTMTFTVMNGVQPVTLAELNAFDQKRFVATRYLSGTRKFDAAVAYDATTLAATATPGQFTIKSAATNPAAGQNTTTGAGIASFAPETSNAQAYIYIAKGLIPAGSAYTLYTDVVNAGKAYGDVGTYVSAANVEACENCHGKPYLKHGYRGAEATNLPDFAACKACHTDTRKGGHQAWQLLVDDPAAYAASHGATTDAQNTLYAYKASVMNDTHMSHAMEFAYPQSMANCATCHEGKLDTILAAENFTLATCKSCHPVTGTGGTDAKRAPALKAVALPAALHETFWDGSFDCGFCHNAGVNGAPTFRAIHSGYDKKIATAAGQKYSQAFKVTIDKVTRNATTNIVTVEFSATESPDVAGLAVTNIVPTLMIAPYGWDSKDFNVAGYINWKVGATAKPEFKLVSGPGTDGKWVITADLTAWKAMITDGTIKRVEIAVRPELKDASGQVLALDAVSKTFDITAQSGKGAFVNYYAPIVSVDKCNKCHDALATTFHSGDRGGSVVACRMCHTGRNGGSHLELASRSIDSYVHAIHSMQPFDIGDVDFTDPVEAMEVEHHVASTYPNFTLTNCESCHNPGTYEVPDQARSLPGILSRADTVADRNIADVPSYVVGPASRACGGCHRAKYINQDNAAALAAFNEHTANFGTQLETTGSADGVLDATIKAIRAMFQ